MGALIAAFGVKDFVYGVLIVAIIGAGSVMWLRHDHEMEAKGAAHELAALQSSSDKLKAQNDKDNAAKEAAWKAESDKAGELYESTLQMQSTAIGVLNGRLRDALANSRKATPGGDTSAHPESDGPTRIPGGVEPALEGVIVAASHDAAKVVGLQTYIKNVCLNPNAGR